MARTKLKKRMQQPKKTVNEKVTCCICLNDITKRKEASLDCCDHKFCKKCIVKWSKRENTCPQCRKKFTKIIHGKREISVEERNQRSDSEGTMAVIIRTTPVVACLHAQVDTMTNQPFINFESNTMLRPQCVPSDLQYTSISRLHTLIWFGNNPEWRNQLLQMLKLSMNNNLRNSLRYSARVVHMLFNIINRFMSNAAAVRTTNFTDVILGTWLQKAHRVVFGSVGSSTEPISLDDIPPARPEHRELPDVECRSNHPHILYIWTKITGLSIADIRADHALLPNF